MSPRKPPSTCVVKASMGGAFSSGSMRVMPSAARSRLRTGSRNPFTVSNAVARASSKIFLAREFIPASCLRVPRRQFAPCEGRDSEQSHGASQQQHDFCEGARDRRPFQAASSAERVNGRKAFGELEHVKQ